jgi:phosphate transport system substrate-binding protein
MMARVFKTTAIRWLGLGLMLLAFLAACHNPATRSDLDNRTRGTIHISVDESFKPVIDSHIKVFEALNPEAKIIAHYKPQAECLKDLMNDSIRMVITTHRLTDYELEIMKDTLEFYPHQDRIAYDAIAVIANKNCKDSLMDMTDIRSLAKGTSGYKYKLVLDGLTATSTVRYAVDSLTRGAPFGKNVVAATNSLGVIDYVSNNEDAIGLIGVSWIGNPEDTMQSSFLKKVKLVQLECSLCDPVVYTGPYQANIARARYPMIRALYYTLKENYDGLGSGFANFLIYEKGQLIFRRAYLWPGSMNFDRRKADIIE